MIPVEVRLLLFVPGHQCVRLPAATSHCELVARHLPHQSRTPLRGFWPFREHRCPHLE